MNEFVYKLTLDLNCAKTPPVICSGQFDKGRKFEFTITANGEPYDVTGCSAILKGVRTDGSHFAVECTVSNGNIVKTLDDNTLSVRGKTVAKLVISDSEKSYSTQMFIIDVDSALDGDITIADDYSILNRLIEQIHALNESGAIIVDDTLNPASNNPIANKSVTKYINATHKQSDTQLIKLTDINTTINGLQITVNNNHIKLKGTATSAITSWISADVRPTAYEKGVTYTGSAQSVVDKGDAQSAIGFRFHYSTGGHMTVRNIDSSISFTPSSNISGDTARLSWNIPAGDYDKEFDLMLEYGSIMTPFEPYYVVSNIENNSVDYKKLSEKIQKEINSISSKAESSDVKSKISLFEFIDITTTETGYYYGSFAHNSDGNWECTPTPIPCVEGDIFRFSASMYDIDNHQHTVKCYESSQKLVGSYCGVIEEGKSAHYNNKIFVVPAGVSYIAFNCWTAMGNRLKVEKAMPVGDLSSQIANGLLYDSPSRILYGRSIYSDGDSIADGAGSNGVSYAHLLRDKYDMTLTDRAVGGTTIAVRDGRTDSIYERITSMTGDYDYILFEGGTNDVSTSINLGVITEGVNAEFDTTTVLGALEGICQFLNTNYFNAQKLFVFVNKRVDYYFDKTNETFAKMKEVLNKWGIPYVDIGNVTNLGNWNDTVASYYFLADKLHPTLKAYKKFYLPYIEKALIFGSYINT